MGKPFKNSRSAIAGAVLTQMLLVRILLTVHFVTVPHVAILQSGEFVHGQTHTAEAQGFPTQSGLEVDHLDSKDAAHDHAVLGRSRRIKMFAFPPSIFIFHPPCSQVRLAAVTSPKFIVPHSAPIFSFAQKASPPTFA